MLSLLLNILLSLLESLLNLCLWLLHLWNLLINRLPLNRLSSLFLLLSLLLLLWSLVDLLWNLLSLNIDLLFLEWLPLFHSILVLVRMYLGVQLIHYLLLLLSLLKHLVQVWVLSRSNYVSILIDGLQLRNNWSIFLVIKDMTWCIIEQLLVSHLFLLPHLVLLICQLLLI